MNIQPNPQPRTLGDNDNALAQPVDFGASGLDLTEPPKKPRRTKAKPRKKVEAKRSKHNISVSDAAWQRLQLNALKNGTTASQMIEDMILSHTANRGIRSKAA